MRISVWLLLTTGVACALLFGQASCQAGGASDSWCNPFPSGYADAGSRPAVAFAGISAHRDEAETRLETVAILPLTKADLDYYGLGARAESPEGSPFLVRGLLGFEGTGRFLVYQHGDDLVVLHGSLGSYMPRPRRRPLVVWLPKEPTHVYVDINVAQ